MIAVVIGPDSSMVRHAVRKHATAADPDGQSTSEMDGNSATMTDVIQAISSVGFFSAGRVVVVNNFIAKMNKTGGRGKNAPDWSALFGVVPEASTLILADPSLANVPVGVRRALPTDSVVVEGDPPRGPQLVKWIRAKVATLDSEISDADARYFAERLYPQTWDRKGNNPAFDRPPNLELMANELDKLVTAVHPEPVARERIDTLVARGDDDRIFGFIDAVMAGNIAGPTTELDRLITAGEDPHRMLAQLGQTIELSAVLAVAERREPGVVGKEIGLSNPARMNAIARGLRNSSPNRPFRAVGIMAAADRRLKTGKLRDPLDVLHYIIVEMAPSVRA